MPSTAKKTTTKKTASRSGNPARKAEAAQVSSASSFKKRAKGQMIELPSGEFVRAKRVELQTFILQGTVPNSLMDIVSDALEKGQKSDIPAMMGMDDGQINLDMVNDMYEIVNSLVCASVIEPKIHPEPTAEDGSMLTGAELEDARDDELLYVGEIDDLDKMFIFQWNTGGVEDLATFREQAGADLDALAEMQGNRMSTK